MIAVIRFEARLGRLRQTVRGKIIYLWCIRRTVFAGIPSFFAVMPGPAAKYPPAKWGAANACRAECIRIPIKFPYFAQDGEGRSCS
jgi:hypothetical protein